MKSLKELIDFKNKRLSVFGTFYRYYIEWIFDQYAKGRNIKYELDKWEENAKAVLLGDIYKNNSLFLNLNFGEEYINSKIARIVLDFYKSNYFDYLDGHNIFCDESMNLRKVHISKENKDELKNMFFVLGGIIVPDKIDINNLLLLLPDFNSGELKYKYFSKKEKMPDCLKSDRFSILFDYMLRNDIKIHFNAENYLYFALTDIIDSIMIFDSFDDAWEVKSCLYHFLMKSYQETFEVLLEYEYPSIKNGKENEFLQKIIHIFKDSFNKNCKTGDQEFDAGVFLLNKFEKLKVSNLPFLSNNTPFLLEDSLMHEYLQTSTIFINNGVTFDMEFKIQNELNNIETDYLDKMNCSFIDSKSNLCLQISDVISGFVARFLKYLTGLTEKEMAVFLDFISENKQVSNNLKKFFELYQKSDSYYRYSICTKMSKYEKRLFDNLSNIACALM